MQAEKADQLPPTQRRVVGSHRAPACFAHCPRTLVGGSTQLWAMAGPLMELQANAINNNKINALSMDFRSTEAPVNDAAIKIKPKFARLWRRLSTGAQLTGHSRYGPAPPRFQRAEMYTLTDPLVSRSQAHLAGATPRAPPQAHVASDRLVTASPSPP